MGSYSDEEYERRKGEEMTILCKVAQVEPILGVAQQKRSFNLVVNATLGVGEGILDGKLLEKQGEVSFVSCEKTSSDSSKVVGGVIKCRGVKNAACINDVKEERSACCSHLWQFGGAFNEMHMVVGGVYEADLINEEHSNVIPCRSERSEKHATHINGNISGVENLQDKHGTVRHKVVGGVNEVILINEEHPNVNPLNDREEWHDKEIVRDSKVGRWVDDWRAGLPDEYEVGGSVGPSPTSCRGGAIWRGCGRGGRGTRGGCR
ncbi:hypothetical protein ACSQ67_011575 [Phaseolus vulgaris]